MKRKCYVKDGKIINIGDWDYLITEVEKEPAIFDKEGNMIKEPVMELVTMNPLPLEAKEEEREFDFSEEHGWREKGSPIPLNYKETLKQEIIQEITGGN